MRAAEQRKLKFGLIVASAIVLLLLWQALFVG